MSNKNLSAGDDFNITGNENQELNRPFMRGLFNAAVYAKDFLTRECVCLHDKNLYVYAGATRIDELGVRYGGRYAPLDDMTLNRLIAAKYPIMLETARDASVTKKIADYIKLYSIEIPNDLSENRELLIFSDGGMINCLNVDDTITYLGSDVFYSSTLTLSSIDYINAPNISQSLVEIAHRQAGENWIEWLGVLIEMLGYLIAGIPEKHFLTFQGAPDSFKSAIVNALFRCWWPYNISGQNLDGFNSQFALDAIPHAAIISFSDAPSGKIKPSVIALLKAVTGSDYVRIEAKYDDSKTMQINSPVIIVTNNPVPLDDGGAYCRAVNLPFFCSFPQRFSTRLFNQLPTESVAIFKMGLQAHFKRRAEGRVLRGYAPLNSFVQVSPNADAWQQLVPNFIVNFLRFTPQKNVFKTSLHAAFSGWMNQLGYKEPVSYDEFCRLFNSIFPLIYPHYSDCIGQVRIGTDTAKGLKNFNIVVPSIGLIMTKGI